MTGRDRAEEAWRLRRHDPDEALRRAEALRDEAHEAGDDVALGRALTIAGACLVIRNDFAAALRALLEALALLDGGPPEAWARALSEAGHLDATLGDHAGGIERLSAALRLYEELEDPAGQADALNRIGVAFFTHGDLDEAQLAYERSLALREPDDVAGRAGVRNNLAKVLTGRGEYDAALDELRRAREGFEAVGDERGLGMTLHNAAVVHGERGDDERAGQLLTESIERYDTAGHTYGACEARTRLARLLAQSGRYDEALTLLRRSHGEAEALGLDHERARAAEVLGDLYEAIGEPVEALGWLRELRAIERRMFDEISEQQLRNLQVRFQLERLERDSITDPLTGLLNRRGLDRALERAVVHVERQGSELAVLLLDLDDFKRVNDERSHSVGDAVLREVAGLLQAGARPTDACVRYGGEEFVVLLPGCTRDRAQRIGEQLCLDVAGHDWCGIAEGLAVTTSVGVALLSEVGDARRLLAAADRALYAAKHAGKDRVR